jgi:hypothetical protein
VIADRETTNVGGRLVRGLGGKPVLRVTKDSVYSIGGGAHEKLADPAGKYYNLILNDIEARLSQHVLKALP